ncbi:aminoglycoside phosphotransferase family protein [Nonomuraea typhae]|uniref:aminoglycoside phosphotransferase family protein n=1 Tax=Nonomuraea typhae TaxID=2603600 RepID=UPI0012F883A6|nr:aminoglycoside phosphotransferase family protein [Nonomuraea typhae]
MDADLVRRLVISQLPQWADLPLEQVVPGGSDHAIFRLGTGLQVRLPRGEWSAGQAEKDSRWLPRLAGRLPLAVPEVVAVGEPEFGYPWRWSVTRWLDGEAARHDGLADPEATAVEVARFLAALQGMPPAADLLPGPHDELAPQELTARDAATRAAIEAVDGVFDGAAMTAVWDAALGAPEWGRAPVWFHGDFHAGNLLTVNGRLTAVIDFGGLGLGDPACDLVIAYTLLGARGRAVFREALGVDDATWARGRGWALSTGLNAFTAYAHVNPHVAKVTTRQIAQALL